MADGAAPWAALHARAEALPAARRACFALACAEHLVSIEAFPRERELRAVLAECWAVLTGGQRDLSRLRAELAAREDLDDDEVAGVAFALEAVASLGSVDATLWASGRALDAAYERVPYPADATRFRPLALDTAEREVQDELSWQDETLELLEGPHALPDLIARLRS